MAGLPRDAGIGVVFCACDGQVCHVLACSILQLSCSRPCLSGPGTRWNGSLGSTPSNDRASDCQNLSVRCGHAARAWKARANRPYPKLNLNALGETGLASSPRGIIEGQSDDDASGWISGTGMSPYEGEPCAYLTSSTRASSAWRPCRARRGI